MRATGKLLPIVAEVLDDVVLQHLRAESLLTLEQVVGLPDGRWRRELVVRDEHQPRQSQLARPLVLELRHRDRLPVGDEPVVVAEQPDEHVAVGDERRADVAQHAATGPEGLHRDDLAVVAAVDGVRDELGGAPSGPWRSSLRNTLIMCDWMRSIARGRRERQD